MKLDKRASDPYWYLRKPYRIDKNVLHEFLWKKSNNGEVRISLRKLAQEFDCSEDYFCRELIPKMEKQGRLIRWSFNEQGSLLAIADPSSWTDLEPKRIGNPGKRKPLPRCAIPKCKDPVNKRDWCRRHYLVWYHHGDVHWVRPATPKKRKRKFVKADPEAVLDGWI